MQPTTTMRPPGPHSTTMDDKTTATLTDVTATKEVSSATTEPPSKTEVPSASTEAPSTTMASSPGPTSLSFVDCVAAVSSTDKSGIDAISALPGKLQQNCPELAKILQSFRRAYKARHLRSPGRRSGAPADTACGGSDAR